jgi:hypothetical protein
MGQLNVQINSPGPEIGAGMAFLVALYHEVTASRGRSHGLRKLFGSSNMSFILPFRRLNERVAASSV